MNTLYGHQDSDQYGDFEQITWGDIKKAEEEICQYFINLLSKGRDPNKFVIEHRTESYTSLFYGNNNFLRVKFTPNSKWLTIAIAPQDQNKYKDSPLFAEQTNKNQVHWKSSFSSKDDLVKYHDLINNACYELPICGKKPLTEGEQQVADKLQEIMLKVGAEEGHFKFYHFSDHAEICYIQGGIRFKRMKTKKKSWIEVDDRKSKKLGNISKFEFNEINEIDKMTEYLTEWVAYINKNSKWYLENGY